MRCPHCGSALGRDAAWCGLCLARVDAPAPVAYAAVPAAAPYPAPTPYATPPVVPSQHAYVSAAPYDVAPPAARLVTPAPPRGALWTTFAAIGVGVLTQVGFWLLTHNDVLENEALIRYAFLSALVLYGVVTWLVAGRLQMQDHPLRWRGSWGYVPSAALGVAVGGGLAWLLLEAAKSAGQEGGDARVAVLVSEASFAHVAVAMLIVCVAAPVVEELLFRGLLLSQFRHHGVFVSLFVSSVAFSAWHLSVQSLVYYSLAGTLLGTLYLRKGLSCSIAAHAAFNGTLLLAAVSYALAPGAVVSRDGLTLASPSGWHAKEGMPFTYLSGPSGGEVVAVAIPGRYTDVTPAELVARVQTGVVPELAAFQVKTDTARTVDLPAGQAVRVRAVADGRDAELVLLPTPRRLHLLMLSSGGSPRVREDFDEMLDHLTVR
jgi:membrane protease YdiL (CAAX protease family)